GEMVILAVDVGEIDARVRRFIQENPVPFPVLLDRDRAATRSWQVAGLPASYVLAPGLAPVLHAQGEVDWDAPSTRAALLAATGPSTQDFMSQNEGGTWR